MGSQFHSKCPVGVLVPSRALWGVSAPPEHRTVCSLGSTQVPCGVLVPLPQNPLISEGANRRQNFQGFQGSIWALHRCLYLPHNSQLGLLG